MTEQYFLNKIENGVEFTTEELEDIIDSFWEESRNYGQHHRWTIEVQVVFSIGDRLFALDYLEAKTEMGENEFYHQPYEVVPKPIIITRYVKKD